MKDQKLLEVESEQSRSVMAGPAFCVYVFGRFSGITRQRLAAAVESAGGRLASRPGAKVDRAAIAHSTAATRLVCSRADLPDGLPQNARIMSELSLRRTLGLSPALKYEPRTLSGEDVARGAKLDLPIVECLARYDVLEPEGGRFGYRDMLLARDAARLLGAGLSLDRIVTAAIKLRRSGAVTPALRLVQAPWGEIVEEIAGHRASLAGQFVLPLDDAPPDIDALFEDAEAAEAEGDLAAAGRLYRLAMALDRTDPVIPFNLGNVLDALGREAEAVIAYTEALTRDPTFPDAWLNAAILHERRLRLDKAESCYRAALEARPDYAEAIRGLAHLLTEVGRYEEAMLHWRRYLARRPDAANVRKLASTFRP